MSRALEFLQKQINKLQSQLDDCDDAEQKQILEGKIEKAKTFKEKTKKQIESNLQKRQEHNKTTSIHGPGFSAYDVSKDAKITFTSKTKPTFLLE